MRDDELRRSSGVVGAIGRGHTLARREGAATSARGGRIAVRRRTVVAAGIAVAVALIAGAGVALAGQDGSAVRTQELSIPGVPEPGVGDVRLDATLYLPGRTAPAPAVLLAHGFGGSKA